MTLVEMLVTLAVLLVMMTIIVQIFQAATGSLSGAQAFQELDNRLRQIDTALRSDLLGVTARMTPPLNPKDNLGYFEYAENAFADLQGEDTDDYVRFTARAPEGRPFTGRVWPVYINPITTPATHMPHPNGPITITSDKAEIIYFLRNGNLYRRVLLIAPERQSSILQMFENRGYDPNSGNTFSYTFSGTGTATSWQGMNDLSARPAPAGSIAKTQPASIILNTLGDLTNRENRAFSPRFGNDYQRVVNNTLVVNPDNTPDDFNVSAGGTLAGDGVPDYYPTLYPGVFNPVGNSHLVYEGNGYAPRYVVPGVYGNGTGYSVETMPFPYIFPGAYSTPEPGDARGVGAYGNGWIHSPTPDPNNPFYNTVSANSTPLTYLHRLNHAPLDQGDNLPRPSNNYQQTWWGFPTWRETLSSNWTDPTLQVNDYVTALLNNPNGQPTGLHPRRADQLNAPNGFAARVANDLNLLPPMIAGVRLAEQPYNDAFGGGRQSLQRHEQVL